MSTTTRTTPHLAWCQPELCDTYEGGHVCRFPSGVELVQWRGQQPEIVLPVFDPHYEMRADHAREIGADLLQASLLAQGKEVTFPDLCVAAVVVLTDRISVEQPTP